MSEVKTMEKTSIDPIRIDGTVNSIVNTLVDMNAQPDEVKTILNEVRDTYVKMWDDDMAELKAVIETARKKYSAKKLVRNQFSGRKTNSKK